MIYKAIGLMSGSSLDGLDIAYVHFTENAGKWNFEIINTDCIEYTDSWHARLINVTELGAADYLILNTDYGHFLGEQVNNFISKYDLAHNVHFISSHGHTAFHLPGKRMTAQLGDGATIAARTKLPVITDLRAIDVALGGQGAPIVPIGEKLLFPETSFFLNIGGIANISAMSNEKIIAFDVCPANKVMDLLASERNLKFDEGGQLASRGKIHSDLLDHLNHLPYYGHTYPKSLANSFGIEEVYPAIKKFNLRVEDALRTYVEHIAIKVAKAIKEVSIVRDAFNKKLLITGGGAFNNFLISRLDDHLNAEAISIEIPSEEIIKFKEALIMAFIGTLRWREEYNVLSSVTGASRDSISGALWLGTEA